MSSMFPNRPKAAPAVKGFLSVPDDVRQFYVVKYHGGRKPFDIRADADDFAASCRSTEKGWAEVIRTYEEIVSPRS